MPRLYEDPWKALRDTGYIRLKLLDPLEQHRIIRGISKEKNADPLKPRFHRIFPTVTKEGGNTYLILELREVTKTRYNVPI
jgi:hypothetical protein